MTYLAKEGPVNDVLDEYNLASRLAEIRRLESRLAAETQRAEEAERQYKRMSFLYTLLSFWTTALNRQSDTAQSRLATAQKELRWAIRQIENAGNARPENLIAWMDGLDFDRLESARAALPKS